MISAEVAVFSRRPRRSAVRNMAAAGWPVWAICAALGMTRERVAAVLAEVAAPDARGSIWGGFAEEFRRVA